VATDVSDLIRAVVFDLDDTLYLQKTFLDAAWNVVAEEAARVSDVDAAKWQKSLRYFSDLGSDKGGIIDRAVAELAPGVSVAHLVDTFKSFRPVSLNLIPGVRESLVELRAFVPIGLITDGDVEIQRAKLSALGLTDIFDVVVLSDQAGREFRKPSPAPFLQALDALGLEAPNVVYVGDRPDKDVLGAHAVGMRAYRVRTGEYGATEGEIPPWREASNVVEAISDLMGLISP